MRLKSIRAFILLHTLAVFAASYPVPAATTLSYLRGVQELKGWFNTFNGRPRLVLLLSPT